MVRADRCPGDFRSVFPGARSSPRAGAVDDARGRKRRPGPGVVYAYGRTRINRWHEKFGQTSYEETPSFYRPRPCSRSYVTHLDDWYAQAHPDEDFAETFAIWLTPDFDWRKRYAGWKAL